MGLFAIGFDEMGLEPITLITIGISGLFFLVSFGLISKNMDSDGIMKWMLKKPDDWVGNKYKDKN
tara:strand:+ start:126 stop:320 length:195 start_codon:yes stop_codon:yes gene_type:complete